MYKTSRYFAVSRDTTKCIASPINVSLEQSISSGYDVIWNDRSPVTTGCYNNCLLFTMLEMYYELYQFEVAITTHCTQLGLSDTGNNNYLLIQEAYVAVGGGTWQNSSTQSDPYGECGP